jgi:response regulator RpfG family c-di-GMP phosphodiesterase
MNRRILLVDDSATFLDGVRALLAPRFEVTLASSGAEALARIERQGPFAAVVSDYAMPGMNGVQFLAEVAEQWPDTARILLTGCADLGLALEALERGSIYRFLTKPPQPLRLIDALNSGVERYHAVEEERLLTEQLAFARESLQTLNSALEARLERALGQLDALAQGTESIARARTAEDVLERTSSAVRELFGARAPLVRKQAAEHSVEIVPAADLRAHERRTLAILEHSARGALAQARRSLQAREAQHAAMRALEHMARQRDDETGEHLVRVSALVQALARRLRSAGHHEDELTDEFIADLGTAAPLHDIGKVAIPDAILFKPGKLDEREWEVMRTHAQVGADILSSVKAGSDQTDLLELARTIAWTHHERWDGTGYPRRIAREAIPLAGRIMALIDCYDALTSERPYKHAWPHHAAVTHIQEQRGLAFDPVLVDAFLAHEDEFERLRAREPAKTN